MEAANSAAAALAHAAGRSGAAQCSVESMGTRAARPGSGLAEHRQPVAPQLFAACQLMAAAGLPCYRFARGRCGAGLGFPIAWLPPGCHVITLPRVTVVLARAILFGRAGPAGRPHR